MNPEIEWEKVSINKNRNCLFHWAFIHAIVLAENRNGKRIEKIYQNEGGGHRVALLINGVQVPIVETFADADKQVERAIEERARELFEERMASTLNRLDDFVNEFGRKIRESFGFELED
jgi:hypothetical protein